MGWYSLVRLAVKGTALYLCYSIYTVARKETILEKARVIREQQIRYGGDFELSEEKQRILEEAEEYMDNHVGMRYVNRSRTEEFFQQQLTKKIEEKEKQLSQISPQNQEQLAKLQSQVSQLKRAYEGVLPKTPQSWEDMREDEEQTK